PVTRATKGSTRGAPRAATYGAVRDIRPANGEVATSSVRRPMVRVRRGDGRPGDPGTGRDVGRGGPDGCSHLQDVRARRPAGSEPERLCRAGLRIDQRAAQREPSLLVEHQLGAVLIMGADAVDRPGALGVAEGPEAVPGEHRVQPLGELVPALGAAD